MLVKHPELHATFENIWASGSTGRAKHEGPIFKVARISRLLGWEWPEPYVFVSAVGQRLQILEMSAAHWQHEVREAQRLDLWRRASLRRPDMYGIGDGIDRVATTSLLHSNALNDFEKGVLRSILTGAMVTQHRLFKAGAVPTARCPHCHLGADEDVEHI
eukprot:8622423-Karenia_brevis.AAC.1